MHACPLTARAPVTDLLNGTYQAEYTVQEAGAYLVRVQLGGIDIMGSPFQTVVLPGKTDAAASYARGHGLHSCVSGVPASLSIHACDELGNERSVCGDKFKVTISGPSPYLDCTEACQCEPIAVTQNRPDALSSCR